MAIETSGRDGSVALAEDGVIVAEATFPHGFKHAAELAPTMDRLLRQRRWRPAEVHELYVSIGPGSFTGLRVGVTAAKVFCFATGARAAAVSSLLALAHQAPAEARHALIVLDAKRGNIFTALYERADEASAWRVVEPPHLDTLAAMLSRAPRPVWLLGEGLPFHQAALEGASPAIISAAPASWRIAAATIARIGYAAARAGDFTDAAALTPLYVRLPEPEEKRLAAAAARASEADEKSEGNDAPQAP